MSVRMNFLRAFVARQDFIGAVADDFIHIHVNAGVTAALPHIQRELVVEFACQHFIAGLSNSLGNISRHGTDLTVGNSCCFLNLSQCIVHIRIENNRKIRCT